MASKNTSSSYRSGRSGRYVTEQYGKRHPSTTVKETSKKK